jgi:subtilisin
MKRLWTFLAIALLVTLLIPANLSAQTERADVLVTFYQPPGPGETSLIESLGGTVKTVYHIVPTLLANMPSANLDKLRADPRVKLVEPDTSISSMFASEVLPWGVDRVDAELVHPTNKGTGVKMAILDSGIDLDHPDLNVAGNVTFVLGTINGDDDNGHGTLVAGIVAALDNEIGVIGVAPEVALYSVKVLNSTGGGVMSVILSGIQWSVDNGMQVMNMSFGGSLDWPASLKQALDTAYNAGMVIVAGAGNGGTPDGQGNNVWAPARLKQVIAVGSTDESDNRYTTSSTGWDLEVMAPGVNIYSTAMGGGYGYITGTSASSPHAAGVAALLITSGLTNNVTLRHRLRDSAIDLGTAGWDPQYGNGLINIVQALSFTEPPDQSTPTTTISLSATMGQNNWYVSDVTLTITATDSGGSGVAVTEYSLDGAATWQTYTAPLVFSNDGSYFQVLARSWDNAGNLEMPPGDWTVFKIDKTPPVVTETANPVTIRKDKRGTMVQISYGFTISDADYAYPLSHTLTDEYGVYSQDLGTITSSGTVWVEAYCEGGDQNGRTYTFRVAARDSAGNEASAQAVSTVLHH